ncbi:hypothetical protein QOT17_013755 [Balamuthia mandrillaris]
MAASVEEVRSVLVDLYILADRLEEQRKEKEKEEQSNREMSAATERKRVMEAIENRYQKMAVSGRYSPGNLAEESSDSEAAEAGSRSSRSNSFNSKHGGESDASGNSEASTSRDESKEDLLSSSGSTSSSCSSSNSLEVPQEQVKRRNWTRIRGASLTKTGSYVRPDRDKVESPQKKQSAVL